MMATNTAFDRDTWRLAHDQLGIGGIQVDEKYGGSGLGFVELGIILEEMGRSLFCGPYFSSAVCATSFIADLRDETKREALLPKLISGEAIATVALYEGKSINLEEISTRVERGYLTGVKDLVIDASIADYFLVTATSKEKPGLYLIDSSSPGIEISPKEVLDPTRKLSSVQFNRVNAEVFDTGGYEFDSIYAYHLVIVATALAHEMIGGAAQMLTSAINYANERVQFGRLISSFQIIKHKCADLLLDVELAKSAVYAAAQTLNDGATSMGTYASMAKAMASDAFMRAANECIQIHGGIGFTWDNDTHLWYKRAKSSEVLYGDGNFHREQYLCYLEELDG